MHVKFVSLLAAMAICPIYMAAQTAGPRFEVASIKRNSAPDGPIMMRPMQPGGRFTAVNIPARQLVLRAYGLQDFQLEGAPGWLESEHYDIEAKAPDGITPNRVGPLLQSLLAERFHLAAHTLRKEMPVLALVPARRDGQLGPKLTRSTADCTAGRGPAAPPGRGGPDGPDGPGPGGTRGDSSFGPLPVCGMRMSPFFLLAGGTPISGLIGALSQSMHKSIQDGTGLSGNFDVELVWTPDESPFKGPPPLGAPPLPFDPNGPPLTTAIQEQLGLKLETKKDMVDVLVIDRVERPSEN